MQHIYIDEKGPQETFRITSPFDKNKKIVYGTDNMHVYVADVIMISESVLSEIESEFLLLEKEYKETRQFNGDKELKGQHILKGNFAYGVVSLKKGGIEFYTKLFEMLNKFEVKNLVFSVSKMSMIIDYKLLEWILDMDSKRRFSAFELKYVLTKYAEIEASEEVIKNLFDENSSVKKILTSIQYDMTEIINMNQKNKRMLTQLSSYKGIVNLIRNWKHIVSPKPKVSKGFNWDKVTYALDLWLTESEVSGNLKVHNMNIYLDQGIPKHAFNNFRFNSIEEECDSKINVGLRISDLLVVIVGNYISKLAEDNCHDLNKPEKIKHISEEWFKLSIDQFYLLKLMSNFLIGNVTTYDFIVDTYFDQAVFFESYMNYICSFKEFNDFNRIKKSDHVKNNYKLYFENWASKWSQVKEIEKIIHKEYGTYREAIESGDCRPL